MRKFLQWLKQGATCVGGIFCQGIIFVVDGVAAVGKFGKETAHVAAEFTVEIIQRVRATKVVQKISECLRTVWEGISTVKEV